MAANRTKEKKKKESPVEELKQEKEEQVSVKELVKDERTHKITGIAFLIISLILFFAFTSYLFTWKEDQDKVLQNASGVLFNDELLVSNLLGRFGAWISHLFFYKGFGVASYLICSIFFIAGVNFLFGKKIFSLPRNLKYVLVGLLVLPVSFSFFLNAFGFPWGGAFGNYAAGWLSGFLGKTGTGLLLSLAAISYIIWRFNPVFSLPQRKPKEVTVEPLPEEIIERIDLNEPVVKEKPVPVNQLKKESGFTPIPLQQEEENPLHSFSVTEKEEEPVYEDEEEEYEEEEEEADEPVEMTIPVAEKPVRQPKTDMPVEGPALEIKNAADEEETEEDDAEPSVKKVVENLPPYDPFLDLKDYKFPSLNLLENHGSEKIVQDPHELENYKNQIINTLRNYDIEIQKIFATVGPTVTLYEIVPAAGVRISRIKNLEDDIALSLAALGIRIIAPIPGKGTIGIEVPNVKKTVVSMKTLLSSEKFQHNNFGLPIAIGKKIDNENFIVDLTTMPHLLMAGATGQGKSVGLNAILVSLLYKKHPSQLKLVLVDPKKVELSLYRHIEKHFLAKLPGEDEAIITDTKKVINTLNALCIEMDNRYDLLKEAGCRNLREYNEKFVARKLNPQKGHQYLPFIVLVVDEFADLIMTAGKEVEMPIARLAQLARAVGIHLIIATQRPSVNIITGTIKANFPARIAFKVSSKVDSRTILDTGGAEQLIGKGDMLISYNGELTRLQCAFVDTPEVDEIVSFISKQRGYPQAFLLPEYVDEKELEGKDFDLSDRDALFEDAARLIVQNQVGSTSLLQRRMKLGYNRAGRLMDQLEAAGIVGPSQGSKARDVLIKTEVELEQHLQMMG
ncbi:S-DNA-T family DNA segregation ATPase FtsK/SpoIIIE [Lacibacter cauensis]|uniref:S-DNA-T family DNA segregation ATPase FtsK/SpoIIIE n=1 Tax=Lacibacter cauensis TaxID=510947 RepID=A0A562SAF4_9BACT|nr:DNA translocase FtsK 4TM domain-containing protein [Lacibacter cauensis]TWI78268.1 S-DNA-T family DNA segregation ATPase FtsK/SpoIIIE [Lacibacter cauensis]